MIAGQLWEKEMTSTWFFGWIRGVVKARMVQSGDEHPPSVLHPGNQALDPLHDRSKLQVLLLGCPYSWWIFHLMSMLVYWRVLTPHSLALLCFKKSWESSNRMSQCDWPTMALQILRVCKKEQNMFGWVWKLCPSKRQTHECKSSSFEHTIFHNYVNIYWRVPSCDQTWQWNTTH
jgi:hypothetical protein